MRWKIGKEGFYELKYKKVHILFTTKMVQKNLLSLKAQMIQTHSGKVILVKDKGIYKADGILTKEKGLRLIVKVADCIPLFIFSENADFAGVLHVGWKGIKEGIIEEGIKKTKELTKGKKLFFSLGPSICKECYEVGEGFFAELSAVNSNVFNFFQKKNNKLYFDLRGLARKLLENKAEEYNSLELCTYCSQDLFYSYRRGDRNKRNLGIIYIEP